MNYRVNLGLLIVLVLLGGVVYYVEQNPATPTPVGGVAGSTPTAIWSLAAPDVQTLAVSVDGKAVAISRDAGSGWAITEPEAGPADVARVDQIVNRIAALYASRTIEPPVDLAEYGLAKPAAEATITLASGETKVLLIGDQTPDRASSYARLPDGDSVFILQGAIGSDLARLASAPPKALPTPSAEDVATPAR